MVRSNSTLQIYKKQPLWQDSEFEYMDELISWTRFKFWIGKILRIKSDGKIVLIFCQHKIF